jgi:hypothetical protein
MADRQPVNELARAASAAALVVAAACTTERTPVRSHYEIGRSEPGGIRTVVVDDRAKPRDRGRVTIEPVVRLAFDGRTLPLLSPDGTRAAVQVRTDATWAVQVGDPLPPEGLSTRIEAVSLDAASPGAPLGTLDGPWILGRAANDEGYLVERPREDGGRDVAIASWRGGVRTVVEDGWTNAFATAAPDGSLAWSRRRPEGGDWQLVVERRGTRRAIPGQPGESWLLPVFAGDGTGLFALRLVGTSMVAAWLPFGADGFPSAPSADASSQVILLSLRANLSVAVNAMMPVAGLSASPPGRERLALWLGDQARMALWAPGGRLERLAEGSVAATLVDTSNALVTLPGALVREQLGPNPVPAWPLADGAWVTRPTTGSQTALVAIRAQGTAVELARLVLDVGTPEATQP